MKRFFLLQLVFAIVWTNGSQIQERSFKFDWVWNNGPSYWKKRWMHVTVQCDGNCIIEGLRLVTSSADRADVDMYSSAQKWAKSSSEFVALGWVFCKGDGTLTTSENCDYRGTLGVKSFHILFTSRDTFTETEFKFKVANFKSVSNTDPTPYVFKGKALEIKGHYLTHANWYDYYVMIIIHCTGYCAIRNIKTRTYYTYRANVDIWGSTTTYEHNYKTKGFRTLGNEFCKGHDNSVYYDYCRGTFPDNADKIYLLLLSKKEFYYTDVTFEAVNYDSWTLTYAPYYNY